MTTKKMGRPTDEIKPHSVHIRLSDNDIKIIDEYCKKYDKNRQSAIRDGIKALKDK